MLKIMSVEEGESMLTKTFTVLWRFASCNCVDVLVYSEKRQ